VVSLAFAYSQGRGVPKDYKRAFEMFRSAAEKGNQAAQYNLSFMFQKGLGVARDPRQADEWYRKACRLPCDFPKEALVQDP
jgi:TPR repeat protein